jgi:hypothetical protein
MEKEFGRLVVRVSVLAFAVWVLWGVGGILVIHWYWHTFRADGDNTIQQLGQLGDLFGGVNALFAAFAFGGVAIAAYYQQRTFALARAAHAQQAFDPLFVHLLGGVKCPDVLWPPSAQSEGMVDLDGRVSFEEAIESVRGSISRSDRDCLLGDALVLDIGDSGGSFTLYELGDSPYRQPVYAAPFAELYRRNEDALSSYLRSLFHVFHLIGSSQLDDATKAARADVARSRLLLSKEHVLLLALAGLSDRHSELKPLIEEFGLLESVWRYPPRSGAETIDAALARERYGPTATMPYRERQKPSQPQAR